jgi:hypothetical protein
MRGCDCLCEWYVLVVEGEEEVESGSQEMDGVLKKGLRPTRGAAPQWPSLQVNHGGVSKRAHWGQSPPGPAWAR